MGWSSLHARNVLVEGKVAYFYPTDSDFRDIYGGGVLYNLEFTYECSLREMYRWTPATIYPWISAGYFHESGKTEAEGTSTSVTIVPIAFGLKYQYCCKCVHPYLGFGLLFPYLHTDDSSDFVPNVRTKWGTGVIAKSGLLFDITKCFVIDVFLDYSWSRINFGNTEQTSGNTADISGLAVGGGLGYRF